MDKFTNQPCRACGTPKATINPEWLRAERLKTKLTLREFAARLGFSAPYISDVELGRRHCTPAILKHYEALRGGRS